MSQNKVAAREVGELILGSARWRWVALILLEVLAAGEGIANPMAAIVAAAMMLDHLKEQAAAQAIRRVVATVLAEGGPRTPDLGGTASTTEVTQAIIDRLSH